MALNRNQILLFAGPSWPQLAPLPEAIIRHPPAARGDLKEALEPTVFAVVIVDGTLFETPGPSHAELLEILDNQVLVLGASSIGALRASELTQHGMLGIGTVYESLVLGLLTDDSELVVAMDPMTFEAITVPLINIRRMLFVAHERGMPISDVRAAFCAAREIYCLERTSGNLESVWRECCPDFATLLCSLLKEPALDVKAQDARLAVDWILSRLNCSKHGDSALSPVKHLYWH